MLIKAAEIDQKLDSGLGLACSSPEWWSPDVCTPPEDHERRNPQRPADTFGLTHVHAHSLINQCHEQLYLCGRVDRQQRDGVHSTGWRDVQDHPFGSAKNKIYFVELFGLLKSGWTQSCFWKFEALSWIIDHETTNNLLMVLQPGHNWGFLWNPPSP